MKLSLDAFKSTVMLQVQRNTLFKMGWGMGIDICHSRKRWNIFLACRVLGNIIIINMLKR